MSFRNPLVNTAALIDGSVTTPKIADFAVTTAKIADLAVGTAKIDAAAITTAKIGDAQVTNAKIENLSASKLTAGTIDAAVINVVNLNADNIVAGIITARRYRTAASGARVDIDPSASVSRIRLFDSFGNQHFLEASAGSLLVQSSGGAFLRLLSAGTFELKTAGGVVGTIEAGSQLQFNVAAGVRAILSTQFLKSSLLDAGTPDYAFVTDPDTGIMLNASNSMAFVTGGTIAGLFNSTNQFHPQGRIIATALLGSTAGGDAVRWFTGTGEIFHFTSSRRYKKHIRDWSRVWDSADLLRLRAVAYESRRQTEPGQWPGLIAEEVVEIFPEVVGLDAQGRPDSVMYEHLIPGLLELAQDLEQRVAALEAA